MINPYPHLTTRRYNMSLSPRAEALMRKCEADGKELQRLAGTHRLLIYDADGKTEAEIDAASQKLIDTFMPKNTDNMTLAEAVEAMFHNFNQALEAALTTERLIHRKGDRRKTKPSRPPPGRLFC